MLHTSSRRGFAASLTGGFLAVLAVPAALVAVSGDGGAAAGVGGVDTGFAEHGVVVEGGRSHAPMHWRRLLNEMDNPSGVQHRRWRSVRLAPDTCVFDPRYLPHTADAVDGWFRNCRGES